MENNLEQNNEAPAYVPNVNFIEQKYVSCIPRRTFDIQSFINEMSTQFL